MNSLADKEIPALGRPVEGKKVLLRPFNASDITLNYLSWLNDPEVVRFSNQRFSHHTLETCRAFLDSFTGSHNHFLGISCRQTGEMLGTITVYRSLHHGTADIGIMLGDRRVWGQGIGYDAFSTVMAALLESTKVRKVTAGTLAVNSGMIRIMQRAGMHLEATRYGQELLEDIPVDVVHYAKFGIA